MPDDLPLPHRSPRQTQRLGAYAVVMRESGSGDVEVLLTRISSSGFPSGWWTLPGGGVDHGESPHDAVERELFEETGLSAREARLVAVHDVHVVDQGRDDMYEDYHGVHLLYRVSVDVTAQPHVVEVNGSTDCAEWVPVTQIGSAPRHAQIMPKVQYVLDHRADFD